MSLPGLRKGIQDSKEPEGSPEDARFNSCRFKRCRMRHHLQHLQQRLQGQAAAAGAPVLRAQEVEAAPVQLLRLRGLQPVDAEAAPALDAHGGEAVLVRVVRVQVGRPQQSQETQDETFRRKAL